MRKKYLRRVLSERLTGRPAETYSGKHTDRGLEQEPLALDAYECETGDFVMTGPFLRHQELAFVGTPDGLVKGDGGVEIKSVIPTVQIETILRESMPPEHRPQVQSYLALSGRRWWDFASFCPDMPDHLRLIVYRQFPDPDYIANLEKEVRAFLADVDALYLRLNERRPLLDLLIASVDANAAASQA